MNNTVKILKPEIIEFPHETLTDRQIDNRIRKLAELESDLKRIKKEIDSIKEEIKATMNSDEIRTTKWIIRNTVYERAALDTKRLKSDFPEVYEEYTKVTVSTRFSYKEV